MQRYPTAETTYLDDVSKAPQRGGGGKDGEAEEDVSDSRSDVGDGGWEKCERGATATTTTAETSQWTTTPLRILEIHVPRRMTCKNWPKHFLYT
jgi:hypothetical protein